MTPSELLHIANAAKAYARRYIQKSNTQLVTQSCKLDESFFVLQQAIMDMRALIWSGDFNAIDNVNPDPSLFQFQHQTDIIRKYSLGNCREFALLAMEYVVDQPLALNAYMVHLGEGDHVILLLLPRQEGCLDEGVVCDPWSDLVCTVPEAYTTLKTYHYSDVDKTHYLQPITPDAFHDLSLVGRSRVYQKRHTAAYHAEMKQGYLSKLLIMADALKVFSRALANLSRCLSILPDENAAKLTFLLDKIVACQAFIAAVDAVAIDKIAGADYHTLQAELQTSLKTHWQTALAIATFSAAAIKQLKQPDTLDRARAARRGHAFAHAAAYEGVKMALTVLSNDFERLQTVCVTQAPAEMKSDARSLNPSP